MVGRRGISLVVMGLSLGVLGSFGFTRVAEALLYGVTATRQCDLRGHVGAAGSRSLTAIYIPARAATRLDAVRAIRCS